MCEYQQGPDRDTLWFMEQTHNGYLTWIVVWLTGGISTITILLERIKEIKIINSSIPFILYIITLIGMSFCIYRLTNIVREIQEWILELKNEELRCRAQRNRGFLSKFFVNNEGLVCRMNAALVTSVQNVSLILLFVCTNGFDSSVAIPNSIITFLITFLIMWFFLNQ